MPTPPAGPDFNRQVAPRAFAHVLGGVADPVTQQQVLQPPSGARR